MTKKQLITHLNREIDNLIIKGKTRSIEFKQLIKIHKNVILSK